jgi:CHAT domain-containing protein
MACNKANNTTTMDWVISSYSPTIRALHHAQAFVASSKNPPSLTNVLLVSMPQTPGQRNLPGTAAETQAITEILKTEPRKYQLENLQNPTRDQVVKALPNHPIAHFACHGSYRANPSESSLLLRNSELKVLEVAGISMEHAQLAFLAACDTARHSVPQLLDENIHIAGSFQLAGYPRIVASLWKIDDEQAVEVAKNYYSIMVTTYNGDLMKSARALHEALLMVKKKVTGPATWAAYAHYGL